MIVFLCQKTSGERKYKVLCYLLEVGTGKKISVLRYPAAMAQ